MSTARRSNTRGNKKPSEKGMKSSLPTFRAPRISSSRDLSFGKKEEPLGLYSDMVAELLGLYDLDLSPKIVDKYLKNICITDSQNEKELICVHYKKDANLDDPEMPLLRDVRGIIIAPGIGPERYVQAIDKAVRGTIVCMSGGRLTEHDAPEILILDEDFNLARETGKEAVHYRIESTDPVTKKPQVTDFRVDGTQFSLAHDVVVLRIFLFRGKVYTCTHRRLDASRSKYNQNADNFIEALMRVGLPNPEDLYPQGSIYSSIVYTFLLSSREVIKCSRVLTAENGFVIYNGTYKLRALPGEAGYNPETFPFASEPEDATEHLPYMGTPHIYPIAFEVNEGPIDEYRKSMIISPQYVSVEKANEYLIYGHYPPDVRVPANLPTDPRLHVQEAVFVRYQGPEGYHSFKIVPPGLKYSCPVLGEGHNLYRGYVMFHAAFTDHCFYLDYLYSKLERIEQELNRPEVRKKPTKGKRPEAELTPERRSQLNIDMGKIKESIAEWEKSLMDLTPIINPLHVSIINIKISDLQNKASAMKIVRNLDHPDLFLTRLGPQEIRTFTSELGIIRKITYMTFLFCANVIHVKELEGIPTRFSADRNMTLEYLESHHHGTLFTEIPIETRNELGKQKNGTMEEVEEMFKGFRKNNPKIQSETYHRRLKIFILTLRGDLLYRLFYLVSLARGINTANFTNPTTSRFRKDISFPVTLGEGNVRVMEAEAWSAKQQPVPKERVRVPLRLAAPPPASQPIMRFGSFVAPQL